MDPSRSRPARRLLTAAAGTAEDAKRPRPVPRCRTAGVAGRVLGAPIHRGRPHMATSRLPFSRPFAPAGADDCPPPPRPTPRARTHTHAPPTRLHTRTHAHTHTPSVITLPLPPPYPLTRRCFRTPPKFSRQTHRAAHDTTTKRRRY